MRLPLLFVHFFRQMLPHRIRRRRIKFVIVQCYTKSLFESATQALPRLPRKARPTRASSFAVYLFLVLDLADVGLTHVQASREFRL